MRFKWDTTVKWCIWRLINHHFVSLYALLGTCILQSELEIEPRYPLFGGWKATFVIGYGLPLQDFLLESSDGRRYLNFTFGCPLADTVVDKLTIKVRIYSSLLILSNSLYFVASLLLCKTMERWVLTLLCFRLCCQRDQKTHLLLPLFQ